MAPPVVALTERVFPDLEPTRRVLGRLGAEILLAEEPTSDAILKVARNADAIMVTYAQITAGIIQQLDRCRIIARTGIGVDNLDIEAATKAGIVVTYVPDYCIDEVSDHALSLLLALVRKIPYSNMLVNAGRWSVKAVSPLHRLRGRTLGLVGFGRIPRALVPKAQAFGLNIITYDPLVSCEDVAQLGAKHVSFAELLEMADYISIHAPLTPETHHMFDADAFERMKPEALLINTARGPIVNVQALATALDAGQLAGAALDVLPDEPPRDDLPILGRGDVVLTPHTAWYSEEALTELQTKAAEDIAHVLRGEMPRYPINPEVLENHPGGN